MIDRCEVRGWRRRQEQDHSKPARQIFFKDFFLAVWQTVGVGITVNTEEHTIAGAQLRMLLAWTGLVAVLGETGG